MNEFEAAKILSSYDNYDEKGKKNLLSKLPNPISYNSSILFLKIYKDIGICEDLSIAYSLGKVVNDDTIIDLCYFIKNVSSSDENEEISVFLINSLIKFIIEQENIKYFKTKDVMDIIQSLFSKIDKNLKKEFNETLKNIIRLKELDQKQIPVVANLEMEICKELNLIIDDDVIQIIAIEYYSVEVIQFLSNYSNLVSVDMWVKIVYKTMINYSSLDYNIEFSLLPNFDSDSRFGILVKKLVRRGLYEVNRKLELIDTLSTLINKCNDGENLLDNNMLNVLTQYVIETGEEKHIHKYLFIVAQKCSYIRKRINKNIKKMILEKDREINSKVFHEIVVKIL